MTALLILALTLHPATAKPVPSTRVVYSCPAGEGLYIKVRGGYKWLKSLGDPYLAGTDIVIVGEDAYYPASTGAPRADDQHYCIAK